MNLTCINKDAPSFKQLQNKYQVPEGTLEVFIYTWLSDKNETSYNLNDPDFIDFLDTKFLLKNSQNIYTDKESYEIAHKYWEDTFQEGVLSIKKEDLVDKENALLDDYDELKQLFEDENVLYTIYNDVHTLRVSEPVFVNQDTEINKAEEQQEWAQKAENSYEVSSQGDKRFSALYAKFASGTVVEGVNVGGMTIEKVYQEIIKKSGKNRAPSKNSILYVDPSKQKSKKELEDFSYEKGYLPLWEIWAGQNPKLIEDLKIKSKGKILTDKFANTRVSQARALADIINNNKNNKEESTIEEQQQEEVEKNLLDAIMPEETTTEIDSLEKAKALVDKMIEDSENIVFDPINHTYTVDGKLADTSVTQFIYKDNPIEENLYSEVSSTLGTTVDTIVRDFFSNNLQDSYPNLNEEMLNNLTKDLQKLRGALDERFGVNQYGVVTQEFPIASSYIVHNSDGTTSNRIMAGIMDMLIYDKNGDFYIYDVKTKRSNNYRNTKFELDINNKENYAKQTALYKAILESKYPELKGKIKSTEVILFNVKYPAPFEDFPYSSVATATGIKQMQLIEADNQVLHNIQDNYYVGTPGTLYNISFSNFVKLDIPTELNVTFVEDNSNKRNYHPLVSFKQTPEDKQILDLYESKFLTTEEISFLSRTAISSVSTIITKLQNDKTKNTLYFKNKYENIDFTTKSRQEIIDIIGLTDLFTLVKNTLFESTLNGKSITLKTQLKLNIAKDNWDALIRIGYARLIALEKVTVMDSKLEDLASEELDTYLQDSMEDEAVEGKTNESWQIGQRHVSAKSGLSANIRRIFENLLVLDSDGTPIYDKFGFNFTVFVDSNIAVNSILNWVHKATTIEEMEKTLKTKAAISGNEWLNTILDIIKKEPIRSQFFQNFRKDFTKYSIVKAAKDSKGNYAYTVHIINTSGMAQAMLEEIEFNFKEGRMSTLLTYNDAINFVLGDKSKGQVKVDEVKNLQNSVLVLNKSLRESFNKHKKNNTDFGEDLDKFLSLIKSNLDIMGIKVNEETIKNALSDYEGITNYEVTNVNKLLSYIEYMTNTLLKNKNETNYDPMAKGTGLYSDYKNIVAILEGSVQESIESAVYENGKTYYSYSVPSYMGKMVTNLKDSFKDSAKFEDYMQTEYLQHKWFHTKKNEVYGVQEVWNNSWLRDLYYSPKAREQFDHKTQLNFNKVDYPELGELSYTLSLMQEYFYDKSKTLAWYRVPILSNKPSSEFVRFKRETTFRNITYQQTISRKLRDTLNQELLRIRTVLERAVNPKVSTIEFYDITDNIIAKNSSLFNKIREKQELTFEDLLDNEGNWILKGTGAEFKFLEVMNIELKNKTELGQLLLDKINNVEVDEVTLSESFEKSVMEYMKIKVASEIANMKDLGVFDVVTTKVKINSTDTYTVPVLKYISNLANSTPIKKAVEYVLRMNEGITKEKVTEIVYENLVSEAERNIEEYIWNDMFATINIIQLTATDLAYYKNIDNFQKRIAQVHSPADRLNVSAVDENGIAYSSDGKARAITIADEYIKSEITTNISVALDHRINSLKGQQKEDLKIMKELIMDKFSNVNISDGQAISAPTSYRKKLGMAGKWDSKMEEAYNRIVEGNFNIDDLGILMTPLKPFVYTQVSRNSGASAMSTIKVGVQNKNSEYLLLLADALMRGGNLPNKLTAIFDFMENTAYDGRIAENGIVKEKGKYNGKGIDTVQFASAVKTGKYGIIDINNLTTYDEILNALTKSTYYNNSREDDFTNNNDRYNDNYVTTFSFEDYGIQQEVPNHFTNHSQTMGTQMRILGISDVNSTDDYNVAGKKEKGVDIVKEYQDLTAENINESIKILEKELNLNSKNSKAKNVALSKILKNAILKDQRYGPDLLLACSLNTDLEFNVPLSDSIHSVRIQQLLNSIIKSRINKQQMNGGPVVQVSAFGLSDTLNIRFKDKNGKLLVTKAEFEENKIEGYNSFEDYVKENQHSVAYFEVYLPIPSKELEESMTKSDGTFMSIEEAVKEEILPDSMRQAIGYRIPTEDKYSMAPMYIKGFTPKAMGHVVMLPREITTLSGSDFDIDKLYIMLKEFKRVEKTNWKALKLDVFNHFYPGKNVDTKKIKNDIDIIIDEIKKGNKFSVGDVDYEISKFYLANKDKYAKVAFTEITNNPEEGINTLAGRKNRMFDINWAVLTNSNTMEQMFNPGSFDVQKRTARIITILKNNRNNDKEYTYEDLKNLSLKELDSSAEEKEQRSILFPSTQIYLHKQNMAALKLIGIFANHNTSNGFVSLQNITLVTDDEKDLFTLAGIKVKHGSKLDSLRGHKGILISRTIAEFLAASVDAVSDPVLNHLNLNTFTAPIAMTLVRLGFDSDIVGLFLAQPVIEKITREYFKASNEGYVNGNLLVQKEIELLQEKLKAGKDTILNASEDINISIADLTDGLKGNIDNQKILNVLMVLQKLLPVTQDLNSITFFTRFNSTANAAGPNIADTFVLQSKYKKILDKIEKKQFNFSKDSANIINNSPILKAFYEGTVSDLSVTEKMFKSHFPHYSPIIKAIIDKFNTNSKTSLDSKTINSIINDYILFNMTVGDNYVIDGSFKNRKKYLSKEFIDSVIAAKAKITDNKLLNSIKEKFPTKSTPFYTLETSISGATQDELDNLRQAWDSLIANEETKDLGLDLFYYNVFRNGFSFSPKTFAHLASTKLKYAVPGYIQNMRDVTKFEDFDQTIVDNFVLQYYRNHTKNRKIVPRIVTTENKNIKVSFTDNPSIGKKIATITYKDVSAIDNIVLSAINNTFSPVITIDNITYIFSHKESNDINSLVYIETTTLGNNNNALEYDNNDKEMGANIKSVLLASDSMEEDDAVVDTTEDTIEYTDKGIEAALEYVKNNSNIFNNRNIIKAKQALEKTNNSEGQLKALDSIVKEVAEGNNAPEILNNISAVIKAHNMCK